MPRGKRYYSLQSFGEVEHKVTFSGSFMQSFTSIGPMLDIAALFSAIAVYSGAYLGIVMLISFLAALTTIYVVWKLSKHFQSNGGYYLFAGKTLGKRVGITTSFVYAAYALLVIPNIALFVSFFILHLIPLGSQVATLLSYVIPLAFLLVLLGIVSQGLGRSIKYTIGAGAVEMAFVLILDFLFIKNASSFSFPVIPTTMSGAYSVFSGVVFGILAFAGMESPVYLSEDTRKKGSTVPRALIYSYLVTGVLLVISAFSIMAFLGSKGVLAYSSNPFYVNSSIMASFGLVAYGLFAVLAIISSMNLCVAYSNAVLNEIRRMAKDNILSRFNIGNVNLISAFLLLEAVIIIVTNYFLGNFVGFIMIAAIVSFSYMFIQVIGGLSLMKLSIASKGVGAFSVALVSVLVLGITVVFSFIADIGPGSPTRLSIMIFLAIVALSALVSVIGSTKARAWYNRVEMSNALEIKDVNDP